MIPKRGVVVISHDAFRLDEEKAATPDPLMGIFPLRYGFDDETEQATLSFYLKIAKRYIGSPLLSRCTAFGRRVQATGALFGAQTGHHHTEVLMNVARLAPTPHSADRVH